MWDIASTDEGCARAAGGGDRIKDGVGDSESRPGVVMMLPLVVAFPCVMPRDTEARHFEVAPRTLFCCMRHMPDEE